MLATGRSMIDAIENLIKKGAEPRHITIVSIIAAPDGIKAIREKFPNINIVVGCVDKELDVKNYIVPGLGDFGNNFFDCNTQQDFANKIDKCLTMRPNADVGNNTILQMQKQCKDALMVRFKESAAKTADIVRNSIPQKNRDRAKSRWDESFEMIKWNNFVQRTINKDNLEKVKK
jgi:hypothetical protein